MPFIQPAGGGAIGVLGVVLGGWAVLAVWWNE